MGAALSMHQTAERVGLSSERFRKVWKTWARTVGFPPPFRGGYGPRGYAWDADDVEAWKAARKRALIETPPQPDAANDPGPPPPRTPRAQRQLDAERAELIAMMRGGQ